ncbi:MAG: divergent PAP2 family protein [Candidatus Eisenbacteria bacterium]|uniref:Divergent PAP2 family protein n=1 Tax=Eiseniibacteriota bacterium TaxID=2212470 RepID=A0A7Y2ED43_UNCEI|nr:divergent PAP2 family protein [Candidatus Eisenbacteria bacterium]
MKAFMASAPYLVALSAGFLVQFSKFVSHMLMHREINFRRLVGTGGMPSAHSASVAALSTAVGFREGTGTTLFAVTLFFSLVVMYDAAGLRRAAGLQARVLNRIVEDQYAHRGLLPNRLSELLGHTPFEVLVGALLGVLYGVVWYL